MKEEEYTRWSTEPDRTWYGAVYLVATSQCTNVSDKVFGVPGLLSEQRCMYPDYVLEMISLYAS